MVCFHCKVRVRFAGSELPLCVRACAMEGGREWMLRVGRCMRVCCASAHPRACVHITKPNTGDVRPELSPRACASAGVSVPAVGAHGAPAWALLPWAPRSARIGVGETCLSCIASNSSPVRVCACVSRTCFVDVRRRRASLPRCYGRRVHRARAVYVVSACIRACA